MVTVPVWLHAALRASSFPVAVSKLLASGQIRIFVPMPIIIFSLSVTAFSSTISPPAAAVATSSSLSSV